jgi:hypothetical protein
VKRLIAIGICSLALSTQFSQAGIINSFEFDDATDTPFADASGTGSDSVTFGSFAGSVYKSNGSGQAVWSGGGNFGIVYSRLDFDSWDLAAQGGRIDTGAAQPLMIPASPSGHKAPKTSEITECRLVSFRKTFARLSMAPPGRRCGILEVKNFSRAVLNNT